MSGYGIQKKGTSPILKGQAGHGPIPYLNKPGQAQGTHGGKFNKGGRVGLKKGTKEYPGEYKGKGGGKGFFQKVGEKISRKLRGKELTEVKGIEQDIKTGALTHKAPKDRMDTKPGRWWKSKIATGPHLLPGTKITPPHTSNDMSYKARKKEIAKEKKEADRKKAFDKKHGVK